MLVPPVHSNTTPSLVPLLLLCSFHSTEMAAMELAAFKQARRLVHRVACAHELLFRPPTHVYLSLNNDSRGTLRCHLRIALRLDGRPNCGWKKHSHKDPPILSSNAAVHGTLCGKETEKEDDDVASKPTLCAPNAAACEIIRADGTNDDENWLSLQRLVESDWSGSGSVRVMDGGDDAGGRWEDGFNPLCETTG